MTILQKFVAECKETVRVTLFIDGFDECDGNNREQLDLLTAWVRSSSGKKLSVKACIASRIESQIELRLSNEPTFAIHQFTEHDISTYVTERLGKAWDLMARQPDGTKAEFDQGLIDKVVGKAEGVFIWVTVVVSQLVVAMEEEAGVADLHRLLADLPEGVEKMYASVLDKTEQRHWPDTIKFLRLLQEQSLGRLRGCGRVETLLEFSATIQDPTSAISCKAFFEEGFTIDEVDLPHHQCAQVRRRLLRSCRGLVEIEDTEDLPSARVTLLHRTVEEYVTRSQIFQKMIDKIENKLLRDPAVALMAMKLCLLKVYSEDTQDRYESLEFKRRYSLTTAFFLATEGAERSTKCSQHLYIEELDRVLSVSHPDWTNSCYESGYTIGIPPDWNTNLLSLATKHNLFFYTQQQIRTNGKGIIEKAHGRPVLFYAFDDMFNFDWVDATSTYELLLNAGAIQWILLERILYGHSR